MRHLRLALISTAVFGSFYGVRGWIDGGWFFPLIAVSHGVFFLVMWHRYRQHRRWERTYGD